MIGLTWNMESVVTGIELLLLALTLIVFLVGKVTPGNASLSGSLTPAHLSYIRKGYIQYGDLAALIPYWTRRGVIDTVFTETGAPICTKKADAAGSLSQDERGLLDALFDVSGPFSPYYIDTAMKARLLSAQATVEADFRTERYGAFTRASMKARTMIRLLGFFSIAIALYDLMLYFLDEPAEQFGGILAAIGITLLLTNPMRKLTNIVSKKARHGINAILLPLIGMLLLFLIAIGIALFVAVYMPEKAWTAWLMIGNYIASSVLYLFALKRTAAAKQISDASGLEDPLAREVSLMNLNETENSRMLEVMRVVEEAWNEAEKVRVPEHPNANY